MKNSIVENPTSEIVLVHPFKDILPDVDEFFQVDNETGVINTIEAFCYKVKKLSDKYKDQIKEEDFKGWALELFVEFLIKTAGADNRIGIYNYTPVNATDEDDVGVDGFGIGENQNPATVQVKFRSGDYVLTANEDHLSNFLTSSWADYGVHLEDDKNMLIVTTGLKVDERTREKMLKGKVRVLARHDLRRMYDNRPELWIRFWESVKASRLNKNTNTPPKMELRQHQKEAVKAIMGDHNNQGKVVLPTGTGKTLIASEVIRLKIKEIQKGGVVPIIKVNSPRILLCFQLFEDVFAHLSSYGVDARYVNFNSGKADERKYAAEIRKLGGVFREIVSTTSTEEVKVAYEKAVKTGIPLIIFSTYHSSEKFGKSELVPHLTIHDEAHNLVSREFHKAATMTDGGNLFFTATEKITDGFGGLGMNNADIFDNMIYNRAPLEMINVGEMVPPYVHIVRERNGVKCDLNKLDKDYAALIISIEDAFKAHQKKIRETSYDASQVGAKILVVCRGQEDLIEMFKTKVFDKFREENPDIHIFALSSDFGLYNDGEFSKPPVTYKKKFEFLKKVKNLKPHEKAIIFHVDMIGEGIDVPGITGVMPFRNSELCKFVQNIGRASRLHLEDRRRLYAGDINPNDKSKWIKPYSWVIIPTFLENSEGFSSRFKEIIDRLRGDYGYIPRQHTVIDNVTGLEDEEETDTVNNINKNRIHTDSGLREFDHDFEKMTVFEKILFEDAVQEAYEKASRELDELINLV